MKPKSKEPNELQESIRKGIVSAAFELLFRFLVVVWVAVAVYLITGIVCSFIYQERNRDVRSTAPGSGRIFETETQFLLQGTGGRLGSGIGHS